MALPDPSVSVVIPASNEARVLPACLEALLASDVPPPVAVEVVVVSNGSHDGTAEVARGFGNAVAAKGWILTVLDLPQGGKLRALSAGDEAAQGRIRVYLDADVTVSPPLLASLVRVLDRPEAAYASGRVMIRARGLVSRAYARLWARVPFMAEGVPGCGLFAVNGPGRERWGEWPEVGIDDMFARLQFAPHERHLIPDSYDWPIGEGLPVLIRVRRRQNRDMSALEKNFPHLLRNESKSRLSPSRLLSLALRDPFGFAVYSGVSLAVRFGRADEAWSRAR